MKPKFVSYYEIDKFVERQQEAGKDWFWEGWTVNIFTPHPRARMSIHGRYYNGNWGFIKSISPSPKGKWVFDRKYLNTNGK